MIRISDIIEAIEIIAPPGLQESYDNTGLQIGDKRKECTGVLICVDATVKIVEEAIQRGCNLIVAHHPLFFKGIKRLTGSTSVEKTAIEAVKNGVAIYSGHTSVDSFSQGISYQMAKSLELEEIKVLEPRTEDMLKLTVWTPASHTNSLLEAFFNEGCGSIGRYDNCSFRSSGLSTFRPLEGSNPYVGDLNENYSSQEEKIELVLHNWMRDRAEDIIRRIHPYEEPAYEFSKVRIGSLNTGMGVVGKLKGSLTPENLIELVKKTFDSPVARCTSVGDIPIEKVALCGGSGSSLIGKAIASGAGAFITSDTKYHDFVDYADRILIIDIGHHESERCSKFIFHNIITKKFPNFAVHYSQSETNPILYR